MAHSDPIQRLVRELSKLPGIGQKTAARLAFHILRAPSEQARALALALVEVKEKIRLCSICMSLTEADPCAICQDPARDKRLLVLRKKDPETIIRSPGPTGHRTFH